MKLGVLFSGGKDSCLALYKAQKASHKIVCLINIISENKASYMFHTPNFSLTEMQSKAIGIPLMQFKTKGEKEIELEDLKNAIVSAKKKYKIEGIVTGAVRSVYQASRIQKICDEIGLKCVNPLWMKNQLEILREIVKLNFNTIISGVSAYPLEKELLGKTINFEIIGKMALLEEKYKINPAGEGGEIETTVLDAPFFRKKIEILKSETEYENYSGTYEIKKAKLVNKI